MITYVRYLDDMVVLARDTPKGRLWADRALQRVRLEAQAIGVDINEEKTKVVTITDPHASFAFLGFDFRWERSKRSGTKYPHTTPRAKKVHELQAKIRETLDHRRHLTVADAVAALNPVLRGWVNYFRVGNSAPAFGKIKDYAAMRVRRFAARQRQRKGFGWKRWSSDVIYKQWGLFDDYKVHYYGFAKALPCSNRPITPV